MATPIIPVPAPHPSGAPIQKVSAAAFAGLVVNLIVAILNYYVLPKNNPISSDITTAASAVIMSLVAYLVPPGANETTAPNPNGSGTVSAKK